MWLIHQVPEMAGAGVAGYTVICVSTSYLTITWLAGVNLYPVSTCRKIQRITNYVSFQEKREEKNILISLSLFISSLLLYLLLQKEYLQFTERESRVVFFPLHMSQILNNVCEPGGGKKGKGSLILPFFQCSGPLCFACDTWKGGK